MTQEDDNDGDYFIPLTDQRVFGAGIKKKGIAFVPASTGDVSTSASTTQANAGDRYLAMVLGGKMETNNKTTTSTSAKDTDSDPHKDNHTRKDEEETEMCPVCHLPIEVYDQTESGSAHHNASLAHQICLEHSHPPSHLDRGRAGLKYLAGYGWDPDARKGLGTRQEGILHPVKAKEKRNTTGLGVDQGQDSDDDRSSHGKGLVKRRKNIIRNEDKIVKVGAKEVRKLELEKKQKAERLRRAFYGDDLFQYLGSNG